MQPSTFENRTSVRAGKHSKLYECGKTAAAFTVFFLTCTAVVLAVFAVIKVNEVQTQLTEIQAALQKSPSEYQIQEICSVSEECDVFVDLTNRVTENMNQITNLGDQVQALQNQFVYLFQGLASIPDHSETLASLQSQTELLDLNLKPFLQYPWPYNGKFYLLTDKRNTWDGARQYCQNIGADLAVDGIKDYTMRLTIATGMVLEEDVWVGITDRQQEGEWTWIDGTIGTVSDILWTNDQPDNFNSNEHCGELWPYENEYKMNDENCDPTTLNFGLCEKNYVENTVDTTTAATTMPDLL